MHDDMAYYVAFGELAGIYLEDSWVLGVEKAERAIRFVLDVVLTPEHPAYDGPKIGDQHCYRRATLDLTSLDPIGFEPSNLPPATDASGEADHGNIDVFEAVDWEGKPAWQLHGDWGSVLIIEPSVTLTISG